MGRYVQIHDLIGENSTFIAEEDFDINKYKPREYNYLDDDIDTATEIIIKYAGRKIENVYINNNDLIQDVIDLSIACIDNMPYDVNRVDTFMFKDTTINVDRVVMNFSIMERNSTIIVKKQEGRNFVPHVKELLLYHFEKVLILEEEVLNEIEKRKSY